MTAKKAKNGFIAGFMGTFGVMLAVAAVGILTIGCVVGGILMLGYSAAKSIEAKAEQQRLTREAELKAAAKLEQQRIAERERIEQLRLQKEQQQNTAWIEEALSQPVDTNHEREKAVVVNISRDVDDEPAPALPPDVINPLFNEPLRPWTDIMGQVVQARLMMFKDGYISLRTADEQQMTANAWVLSSADYKRARALVGLPPETQDEEAARKRAQHIQVTRIERDRREEAARQNRVQKRNERSRVYQRRGVPTFGGDMLTNPWKHATH